MTEHEQSQPQPWTNAQLLRAAQDAAEQMHQNAGMGNGVDVGTIKIALAILNDAWQADHDALVVANEQMAGQIGNLAAERDALQAKLDAAEQRVKELEGELQLIAKTARTSLGYVGLKEGDDDNE